MITINLVGLAVAIAVFAGIVAAIYFVGLLVNVCLRLWIANFKAGKNAVDYIKNRKQYRAWKAEREEGCEYCATPDCQTCRHDGSFEYCACLCREESHYNPQNFCPMCGRKL